MSSPGILGRQGLRGLLFLRAPGLSLAAKGMYMILASYVYQFPAGWNGSLETLAGDANCDVATVRRLQDYGLNFMATGGDVMTRSSTEMLLPPLPPHGGTDHRRSVPGLIRYLLAEDCRHIPGRAQRNTRAAPAKENKGERSEEHGSVSGKKHERPRITQNPHNGSIEGGQVGWARLAVSPL